MVIKQYNIPVAVSVDGRDTDRNKKSFRTFSPKHVATLGNDRRRRFESL